MRKLLDSRNEREVLEGLRRVLAVRARSSCGSGYVLMVESCR